MAVFQLVAYLQSLGTAGLTAFAITVTGKVLVAIGYKYYLAMNGRHIFVITIVSVEYKIAMAILENLLLKW